MFVKQYSLPKMLLVMTSLLFFYNCDEDYVSSLNFINPEASLELTTNLDDLYLGESVENLEVILKVKDSPSISNLAFSISYSPEHFISDTVLISPDEDNLFYNVSPEALIDDFTAFTDSTFEVNIGFINAQDTTYTYGDGEIARLYLNGRNVQTSLNLSLDNVLSYDFNTNLDDWYIEDIVIGKPIPQVYFDNFNYNNESGLLTADLNVIDIPKLTSLVVDINYDFSIISFIDENIVDAGNLIPGDYNLNIIESDLGVLSLDLIQSDGNVDGFIQGTGTIATLKFNLLTTDVNSEDLNLTSDFNQSVFDVCGNCLNPNYDEHYDYDVSFWTNSNQSIDLFGCTDLNASNYSNYSVIDDGSCLYEE